jgi:hypothetical protein
MGANFNPTSMKNSIATSLVSQERECEEILTNATVKLEEHFREINSRLQTLFVRGATMLGEDATAQGGHQVILAQKSYLDHTSNPWDRREA